MKHHFFRTLTAALALTALLSLPALAQEPKQAQPATKEDKTVTDLTGIADFLRNAVGFTTNFGGPYDFVQSEHQTASQRFGDAPEEGAVALLRLYTRADDKGDVPLNTSGHSFITVTNVSGQDIDVGGLLIAPGTSVTIGTRGNRSEHSGVWYDLEGYYKYYLSDSYYQNLCGVQVSLDQTQLDTVNRNLARSDHWSALYNCAAFTVAMWNSVCSDKLTAGLPLNPADLKSALLTDYADKVVTGVDVPYDYIVYYGTDLTPSREFV